MKISIITVCRNDINGLKNTFASVSAQDYDQIEWIVVDGKSVDGTAEWLRDHHRLKGSWLSEPDCGIYDAMNKGIRIAEGDYLLFMNSGDSFAGKDVISKLVRYMEREDSALDFVYGDSLDVDESGKSYYREALPVSFLKFGMLTRHQAMLYRKELVVHEAYPLEFKLSGDYALTTSVLIKKNAKILKVDFPICFFSLGGIHGIHRPQALSEDFKIRRKIMKENYISCVLIFCVHWLHYHVKTLFPALNRKFIYGSRRL